MREGLKDNRYDLRSPPPEPLVPRHLRLGVRERLRADGSVLTPLDEASLDAAIATIKQSGVASVAICYLHAYRNPDHEIATEQRLRRGAAGRVRLPLQRRAAADQGIRARLDHGRERLCRAGGASLPDQPRASGLARPALPAACSSSSRMAAWRRSRKPRGLRRRPCCRVRPAASPARAARPSCWAWPTSFPFDMGGTSTDISLIAGRPGAALGRARSRRRADRAAQPRHRQHRRGRRLDRPGRCGGLSCRPGKRRRGPRPCLLRQRRHAGDRHRRQPAARLSRRRQFPRRRAQARSHARARRRSIRSRPR